MIILVVIVVGVTILVVFFRTKKKKQRLVINKLQSVTTENEDFEMKLKEPLRRPIQVLTSHHMQKYKLRCHQMFLISQKNWDRVFEPKLHPC